jgi:hypothetical protein
MTWTHGFFVIIFAGIAHGAAREHSESEYESRSMRSVMRVRAADASIRHQTHPGAPTATTPEIETLAFFGEFGPHAGTSLRVHVNIAADYNDQVCRARIHDPIEQNRCQQRTMEEIAATFPAAGALSVNFGLLKVPQTGWSGYAEPGDDPLPIMNPYAPFDSSQPALQITTTDPGPKLTLFVTNDTTTKFPGRGEFTNQQTQPTWIMEWQSPEHPISPVVQLGNYDLNHSQFINLGLRLHNARVAQVFDTGLDFRDRKYLYERRRSLRWSVRSQTTFKISATQTLTLIGDMFRLENRRLNGVRQSANRPGTIDQNERRVSVVFAQNIAPEGLRWFVDVRGWQAEFYEDQADTRIKTRSAMQTGTGFSLSL